MMRYLLVVLLLLVTGPMAGCYYTAKDADGTTRRISHKEYNQLKHEHETGAHIGVPTMLD